MANNIKIMDSLLAIKIAAGEVVERPASVVKELVENSIDAGASSITVRVADGGRSSIKVVDNGSGISKEDAPIAFERHATSKITSEDDLNDIRTMGFRGEALPSIASVSRVTLRSRREGSPLGVLVECEGGGKLKVIEDGCREGTVIEVQDLFFNTPARLKFLRTPATEFSRISDYIKIVALGRPDIAIKFFKGGAEKPSIDLRQSSLKERILRLFDEKTVGELIELPKNKKLFGVSVSGFVSRPEFDYPTSKRLFTYVNGRYVNDRSINRAVIEGYMGMLDRGRYPMAVIDVIVPAGTVDVNVHPAKTEVRFKRPSEIFNAVKGFVRDAIKGSGVSIKNINTSPVNFPSRAGAKAFSAPAPPSKSSPQVAPSLSLAAEAMPKPYDAVYDDVHDAHASGAASPVSPDAPLTQDLMQTHEESAETKDTLYLSMRFIGQLFGEFLLTEASGVLFLIDQHAAAERVRFEELRRAFKSSSAESLYLLSPESLDLNTEEAEALTSALPELTQMGFEIIPFGPSAKDAGESFIIKGVPGILEGLSVAKLLRELTEESVGRGVNSRIKREIDSVLMRVACHSVIRGARTLTNDEALALLKSLSLVDFSAHCPHGRPVTKSITRAELDSMFKRS
jgi:DNA mismatch repair protein MutL